MQHLCPGLKVLRQASDPRTLVAPFWRGQPEVTGYLSSPAIAPTLQAGLGLRLPGANLPTTPGTLGPPAHSQPHCDAGSGPGGIVLSPTHVYILEGAPPTPPGQRVVQQWVGGTDRCHCWPPPGGHGCSWLLLLQSSFFLVFLINLLQL